MKISELNGQIKNACKCKNSDGGFSLALTAAFSKSIGLVVELEKSDFENLPYWMSPNLRGICEDLIVLGFLDKNFSDRADEIILLQLRLEVLNSTKEQKTFFSRYRPQQPIMVSNSTAKDKRSIEGQLREIFRYFVIKDQVQPSVSKMAKDQDLHLLYNYLYHASSRLVHFSPHTLLKMVWYDPEIEESECSPDGMQKYYSAFVRFYSAHLLAAFTRRFKEQLKIECELERAILDKVHEVNSIARWPELVTFEELNRESPWSKPDAMRKMSFWNLLLQDPGVIFEPKC